MDGFYKFYFYFLVLVTIFAHCIVMIRKEFDQEEEEGLPKYRNLNSIYSCEIYDIEIPPPANLHGLLGRLGWAN